MTHMFGNRSRLLGGCASAAVALALMLAPERAAGQGIQATGNVVLGSANIVDTGPTTTQVNLLTPAVVINWTPTEDVNGDALAFIPAGSTGIFRTNVTPNFAVLNRILPSTNNNVLTINGTVLSQVIGATGAPSPAGLVAFSSPTGIVVGGGAVFDVGRLLLTTLDATNLSFQNFAGGGNLTLTGISGSTAQVLINPGAQITASPENAFFAVVAADIEMRGTANVNGSHAFVAGEVVNLSFSNGLFDISVPVGTAASGEVLTVDGTVGGLSSTGATGDNHMIYGVAHASVDPISMLFRGNLGFQPAASAGVINGEIILAANYNVFGRGVAGGTISDGINATFRQVDGTTATRADILLRDFASTSSLLAIGTHAVQASAQANNSSVDGNLLLFGRESADLAALFGRSFTVTGDVLADARDYGVVSSSLNSLNEINAQGGNASISADFAGGVFITGNALVTADAFGGADDLNFIAGSARGGGAFIDANDTGIVSISGSATVSARGVGTTAITALQGAEARGGFATLASTLNGSVGIGNALVLRADAVAANGSLVNPSTKSDAFGGLARIVVSGESGLGVGGAVSLFAGALGGSANTAGAGSIGDAGEATIDMFGLGAMGVGGTVRLEAEGRGGSNASGTGGVGRGGRASARARDGGSIGFGSSFIAGSIGVGGNGLSGGDGFGGIAGAIAESGEIGSASSAFVTSDGVGGNASFGFGGAGGLGRGGNAFLQANGNANGLASLTIGVDAIVVAQGRGGRGGDSDGSTIGAGRGGDGFGGSFLVPNQADPLFNSGAFILAGGDHGTISVGGDALAYAFGFGGDGGTGFGSFVGGNGGDGFGGLAQAGLALLGGTGLVGDGVAAFGDLELLATGLGGSGGFSIGGDPTGDGGNGTGGFAALTVRAGSVSADVIELVANGVGGAGELAGNGQGGRAALFGGFGGSFTSGDVSIRAVGRGGGGGSNAIGGVGRGGQAEIQGNDVTVAITGDALVNAGGEGGAVGAGVGGDALGGTAYISASSLNATGAVTITGHALVLGEGTGGSSDADAAGGAGTGGLAYVEASAGGDIALGSAQVSALGRGGAALGSRGGAGTGGIVRLLASDAGSTLTIARNVPTDFASGVRSFFMLNANGVAEGNNAIGNAAIGTGGTLEIRATGGGFIGLPTETDIASDLNSASPFLGLVARGLGGNSFANFSVGGDGIGGSGLIETNGANSAIVIGLNAFSMFGQGGSSAQPSANIAGGTGIGGNRRINVLNGSTLTFQSIGGVSGGLGGNASGTGNGGEGLGGFNQVVVNDSTLNVIGTMLVIDQSTGGRGVVGGNGLSGALGGVVSFTATNSRINMTANASGNAAILLGGITQGGQGVLLGGTARTSETILDLNGTQVIGGRLIVDPIALGGSATDPNGNGGNAFNAPVQVSISNSDLAMSGTTVFSAVAEGGTVVGAGTGGSATSGIVNAFITDSALAISQGVLRTQSIATGGAGATIGNAASNNASLFLTDAIVFAGLVEVATRTFANGSPGQTGGIATSGQAALSIGGGGALDANDIVIDATARTGDGGSSAGGIASFAVGSGLPQLVVANDLRLLADGLGANAADLANGAGRFAVNVASGSNVTFANLVASAQGDAIVGGPGASLIGTLGGNINVSNSLNADSLRDITITLNGGGLIGSQPTGGTTTNIFIISDGNITVQDDDSGVLGLGGRSIVLGAGGSVLVDGIIGTDNGPITLNANNGSALPAGVNQAAAVTMSAGSSLNAGTGLVRIRMREAIGIPGRLSGGITLSNITAGTIDVRNFGVDPGSNITVLDSGVLTASGSGRAIDLASLGGEVINLHRDAGLVLTGTGHYGVFAATPAGSQIGSFANYARRYNLANEAAYDAITLGGNFAAFRITPTLTVTADDLSRFYGNANPALTATITGFQPGDSVTDLLGAPGLAALADGTSDVGLYTITAALGTLQSEQGYQFTFAPGTLNVTPRPITVTANNLSRIYGNANPALTFTVGGLGLVNGDTLTGAPTTTANATTGVGAIAITQGTLGASSNYALTFVNGALTITARPITITADDLVKLLGLPDPALTFTVGGLGLVNGDAVSGSLVREGGEAQGRFVISQGSLSAGPNYSTTFVPGRLTINAPPIPSEVTNTTALEPARGLDHSPPPPLSKEEEEEIFGMDFPSQPDAQLITDDALLDEPVTSGGDASLYGSGDTAGAGGQ